MLTNEEYLVKKIVPLIRKYIIDTYDPNKMSLSELSRRLGITSPGLIKYRKKHIMEKDKEIFDKIEKDLYYIKDYIYHPNFDPMEFRKMILMLWIKWMSQGIFCKDILRRNYLYSLKADEDYECKKIIEQYSKILINIGLVEVQEAYEIFRKIPNIHSFIPEVSTNIVRLVEVGKDQDKYPVIGFPGRIVSVNKKVITFSPPKIGGSRHMGNILRKIHSKDPKIKGITGVGYIEDIIKLLEIGGFEVQIHKVKSDWELLQKINEVSDIIIDAGGVGREGFIYVLGYDSIDAVRKLKYIIEKYLSIGV